MVNEDFDLLERSISSYIRDLNVFNNVNVRCCWDDIYSGVACSITLELKSTDFIERRYDIRIHFLNPSDVTAEKVDLALKSHPVLKQVLVEKELDDILHDIN